MLMHGQLNGINLKEEVGDNFMSDYITYTNYAKKAIKELEQLNVFKQTLKGKKLAEKIRETGLKWITRSAVDSILHGLGESNNFPNLTPQQKKIAEKLVSLKDDALTYKSPGIRGIIDENAEMAQSDITKIIDYSEKLQSMFDVNDNLEDWVKAKLNHACDYIATVRDYLKFYNEEKDKTNIQEKWTNKYKKSIDCSNARGFSQKAHCRARKLRQAGKDTKSKPVKEYYKEAIEELLKEQDSSMAMGALKQIHNDAKELESMLQTNTQLEDWVKAKLNLAGEYLDDVYHHLDHFGPEGRKLDEILKELNYEGGIGFHEFVTFYKKANQEELSDMENCLINNNIECVKNLIQKVTGMEMDKINESYYADKEKERLQRSLRFSSISMPEKKYWITPEGNVVEAGVSHEEWIIKNDPSVKKGITLIDTYENAIKKGYIRAIVDTSTNFLMLSNMPNYDFSLQGNQSLNIPPVVGVVKDGILDFIKKKEIRLVATGKGKLLELDSLNEDVKKTLASLGLAGLTALGSLGLGQSVAQAAPVKKVTHSQTAKSVAKPAPKKVDKSALRSSEVKLLGGKLSDYIAAWEGKENKVYMDSKGLPTIGIGHYLTNTPQDRKLFKALFGTSVDYDKVLKGEQSLESDQIEKLFNSDVKIKEKLASNKISNLSSLPKYVQNAIINGFYRGDIGPKTIGHINSGNWSQASSEYLDHQNAKSGPDQIKRRMKTNALALSHHGKQLEKLKESNIV
jgi:GH24 family phage-related lysozyme (muramidase)